MVIDHLHPIYYPKNEKLHAKLYDIIKKENELYNMFILIISVHVAKIAISICLAQRWNGYLKRAIFVTQLYQ